VFIAWDFLKLWVYYSMDRLEMPVNVELFGRMKLIQLVKSFYLQDICLTLAAYHDETIQPSTPKSQKSAPE
jgi:hypothetical protein